MYSLLNDKNTLKTFGLRTRRTKNFSVFESHTTDTFNVLSRTEFYKLMTNP